MIYAQIKDRQVKNTIDIQDITIVQLYLDGFDDIVRIDLLDPVPSIGWSYINGAFSPPLDPSYIPPVSPRQFRQALVLMGMYDQIEPALNSLPEPLKSLALIAWEYSLSFDRNDPLVDQVAQGLGWPSDQVDDLWRYAATL
jgi:hypothetical protein